jgi:hypothetical protein
MSSDALPGSGYLPIRPHGAQIPYARETSALITYHAGRLTRPIASVLDLREEKNKSQ